MRSARFISMIVLAAGGPSPPARGVETLARATISLARGG
mgnify:CR=1 FL=1